MWRSLVARTAGGREVAGSSPVIPTIIGLIYMKQQISVVAVIKSKHKVLLVQPEGSDRLLLPGAQLGEGAEPRAALQDALLQQVGVRAETVQLADAVSYIDEGQDVQSIVLVFFASIGESPKLKLAEGYQRYEWKLLSEILPDEVDDISGVILQLEVPKDENIEDKKTTNVRRDVMVYTDGGSRGNPGPSAAGFVILGMNGELLFEGGKYLGITTNNQAEYQAVKLGLEKAHEMGARTVKFRMDSQLIVNQMLGIYQIKNRDLWPIYASIKELIKEFDSVTFMHVRREFNKEADALVNKVLDERGR